MKKTNAIRLLDQHKINYELVAYKYDPDNLSVEHIADSNNLEVQKIYKTLVAKGNQTGIIVAMVPGHRKLNYKLLAKSSGNKKVALVAVKEIQQLTGYVRGGCAPIGMKKMFPVFIEPIMDEEGIVYMNAGQRGLLVGLDIKDLLQITKASYTAICE